MLDVLGMGGMATVYLASLEGPGGFKRKCALKVIHPHLTQNESYIRWFINEARLGGFLHHQHIVQTLEFGEAEGCLFLAMEYVEGVTLAQVLNHAMVQGEKLPLTAVRELLDALLQSLHYAHQATDGDDRPLRLIHRDLKPSNILIGRHGAIKIADFGIARADSNEGTATGTGAIKGTARYMAPEQAAGLNIDQRADLFAVGAIAYELLMLRPLIESEFTPTVLRQALECDHRQALAELARDPERGELSAFVGKALTKAPADRYGSAQEMRRALEPYRPMLMSGPDLSQWLEDRDFAWSRPGRARTPLLLPWSNPQSSSQESGLSPYGGETMPAETVDIRGHARESAASRSMQGEHDSIPSATGSRSVPPVLSAMPRLGPTESTALPPARESGQAGTRPMPYSKGPDSFVRPEQDPSGLPPEIESSGTQHSANGITTETGPSITFRSLRVRTVVPLALLAIGLMMMVAWFVNQSPAPSRSTSQHTIAGGQRDPSGATEPSSMPSAAAPSPAREPGEQGAPVAKEARTPLMPGPSTGAGGTGTSSVRTPDSGRPRAGQKVLVTPSPAHTEAAAVPVQKETVDATGVKGALARPPRPTTSPEAKGQLRVIARPPESGLVVSVDSERRPLEQKSLVFSLNEGEYRLEFKYEGLAPFHRRVKLEAGKELRCIGNRQETRIECEGEQ